jgi:H+/gluconate symporter-like permease
MFILKGYAEMSDNTLAIIIFLTLLIVLNTFVSFYIAKMDDLDMFQKTAQIVLIWLLPIFGALGLFALNKNNNADKYSSKRSSANQHFNGGDGGD